MFMKTGYALRNTIGITLFTATMFFSACDKEDSTQKPTEPVTSAKLTEFRSGEDFIRFEYNADGTVNKITLNEDPISGEPNVTFTVKYRADKKPDELTGTNNASVKTTYVNGLLMKTETFIATEKIAVTDYTYNGAAPNTITGFLFDGATQVPFFRADLIMNSAGNVGRTNGYVFDPFNLNLVPAGHVNMQYDDKPNPLAALNDFMLIFWQMASKNNVIREDHFDADGQAEKVVQTTYTYNSKGYPTKATVKETETGQAPVTTELIYAYK